MTERDFFRWAAPVEYHSASGSSFRTGAGDDPDGSTWATRYVTPNIGGSYHVKIRIRIPGPTLPVL